MCASSKIFIGGLSYETTDGMCACSLRSPLSIAFVLSPVPLHTRSLALSHVPMRATEKLRSYFAAYGVVTDAVVMKDPISRRSRGFGFITYADPSCVDRALAQPNHILDNRRVRPCDLVHELLTLRVATHAIALCVLPRLATTNIMRRSKQSEQCRAQRVHAT